MKTSLPGNPHEPNPDHADTSDGRGMTTATLALAFEQRTRNLIAIATLCTANGKRELGQPFIEQAMERLGFKEALQ